MKKTLLFALFLTLVNAAHAQIVLVSDVDDTIKVSHVLDKDSVTANAAMIHNAFLGMPQLYRLIAKHPEMQTVKYLSNSPQRIFGDLHQKFLKVNGFPRGDLVGRRWSMLLSGNNHKINALRRFALTLTPREFLLIGDNGEHDTQVYAQFRKEFPQYGGLTYIHQAYSSKGYHGHFSKPLEEGQIGFTTSVDIALDLLNRGYLKLDAVEAYIREVVPMILAEGNFEERGHAIAFPAWLDCRDYKVPELPVLTDVEAHELLQQYATKLQARCEREPYRN